MWWNRKNKNALLDDKYLLEQDFAERKLKMAQDLRLQSEVVLGKALGDPVGESLTQAMERKGS